MPAVMSNQLLGLDLNKSGRLFAARARSSASAT